MSKGTVIAGVIAAVAVIGAITYVQFSNRQMVDLRDEDEKRRAAELDRKFEELKKEKLGQTATSPVAPIAPAPAATQASALSVLEKQRATQEIKSEGFKLLATRDPKDAQQAIALFKEGIDHVDPANSNFYHGLGRALIATNQYKEALRVFIAGRKLDKNSAEIASGLGWAFFDTGDYYDAKIAWEESIRLDPTYLDPWTAMAWVYLALGDKDRSAQGFVTLLKVYPDRKEWQMGLGMARSGNAKLDAIRSQFPNMPDPQLFVTAPASTAPATTRP